MDRLTIEGFDYDADFVASHLQSWPIAQALKRLAEYENTDFVPKQITVMQANLEDAEETIQFADKELKKAESENAENRKKIADGVLIELPCNLDKALSVYTDILNSLGKDDAKEFKELTAFISFISEAAEAAKERGEGK